MQRYAFSPEGVSHVELKPFASSSVDKYCHLGKEAKNVLTLVRDERKRNNMSSYIHQKLVGLFYFKS